MKVSEEEHKHVLDDENHDEYSGVEDKLFNIEHGTDDTKDVEKMKQIDIVSDNDHIKQQDTVTPVSQAGPIVLINIHANGLNLDSADQIAEAIQKTLGYKEETIETEKLKVKRLKS